LPHSEMHHTPLSCMKRHDQSSTGIVLPCPTCSPPELLSRACQRCAQSKLLRFAGEVAQSGDEEQGGAAAPLTETADVSVASNSHAADVITGQHPSSMAQRLQATKAATTQVLPPSVDLACCNGACRARKLPSMILDTSSPLQLLPCVLCNPQCHRFLHNS
jgi:hypothetical protein